MARASYQNLSRISLKRRPTASKVKPKKSERKIAPVAVSVLDSRQTAPDRTRKPILKLKY